MHLPTFSVDDFDYNKSARTFVSEASTLGISPGVQLWRVQLSNPKTGNSVIFYLSTRTGERCVYSAKFNGVVLYTCIYNT